MDIGNNESVVINVQYLVRCLLHVASLLLHTLTPIVGAFKSLRVVESRYAAVSSGAFVLVVVSSIYYCNYSSPVSRYCRAKIYALFNYFERAKTSQKRQLNQY